MSIAGFVVLTLQKKLNLSDGSSNSNNNTINNAVTDTNQDH